MEKYDAIIIGAGPIGLACGVESKKAGLNYLIIEKGCLVNSLYHYPMNMTFFSTSERLEIGDVPFISSNPKPTRVEALEYYRRVCSSWNLNVRLYEEVKEAKKSDEGFSIVTTKGKHYYDEPHPYYLQKIAVIGAANSAVDVALETWRKGAEVTMIIREGEIRDSVKYWVKPDIENRIKEGSIKAFFNSTVTRITETQIEIKTPEGNKTLDNDFVMAMTGYQPPFDFMKSIGIQFQNDEFHTPVYNEQTMETNVSKLYLAGVVCGGLKTNKWFIENSRDHAKLIVKNLAGSIN